MAERRRRRVPRSRRRDGNTLLYFAIGFCMIGSLLAVAVPTFWREMQLSRSAEAAEMLQRMHLGASAYFATPHEVDGVERRRCLPLPAGPTPRRPRPSAHLVDFQAVDAIGAETWGVLEFESPRALRYSYQFEPVDAACDLRSPERTFLVTYRAEGDLDGDGARSLFERRDAASNTEDVLVPIGILYERDRQE